MGKPVLETVILCTSDSIFRWVSNVLYNAAIRLLSMIEGIYEGIYDDKETTSISISNEIPHQSTAPLSQKQCDTAVEVDREIGAGVRTKHVHLPADSVGNFKYFLLIINRLTSFHACYR